jgi:hypothetical protein
MKLHTLLVPHVIPRRFRKRCHKSEAEEMQPEELNPEACSNLKPTATWSLKQRTVEPEPAAWSLQPNGQNPKPKNRSLKPKP